MPSVELHIPGFAWSHLWKNSGERAYHLSLCRQWEGICNFGFTHCWLWGVLSSGEGGHVVSYNLRNILVEPTASVCPERRVPSWTATLSITSQMKVHIFFTKKLICIG